LRKGRIYAPRELMDRFGVKEWDLNAGRVTPEFHALMAELIARPPSLFDRGRPLCDLVGRDLRFEMRLTWLGGSAILDAIEKAGDDVFHRRPRHGAIGQAGLVWRAWRCPARAA